MTHILLDLNGFMDLWINTLLDHYLYLKIMEGHLLMIDFENLFVIFFFCINKLIQVATLDGAMDVSP